MKKEEKNDFSEALGVVCTSFMTSEFGLTGYESAGREWGAGDPREITRGDPNEKYGQIHLKQPRIFYDFY